MNKMCNQLVRAHTNTRTISRQQRAIPKFVPLSYLNRILHPSRKSSQTYRYAYSVHINKHTRTHKHALPNTFALLFVWVNPLHRITNKPFTTHKIIKHFQNKCFQRQFTFKTTLLLTVLLVATHKHFVCITHGNSQTGHAVEHGIINA